MKLICVKDMLIAWPLALLPYKVVVGREYESVGSEIAPDGLYFNLAGMPDYCLYHEDFFAILSDKTADEMSQEEKEAIVNLETPDL